jgi:hypothetical protein
MTDKTVMLYARQRPGRIHLGDLLEPATREDVLAAVRELGGVEVWWCEEHKSSGVGPIGEGPLPQSRVPGCDFAMMYVASEDRLPENRCHISAALIVPLDTGDTE